MPVFPSPIIRQPIAMPSELVPAVRIGSMFGSSGSMYGGRIFLPPYMDPLDPNIDPILTAGTNSLGMAIGWRMIGEGKTGIAYNAAYDQWSPARQYSLYHRGVRILTETASARLATAVDIPFDQLGPGRGYDAKTV